MEVMGRDAGWLTGTALFGGAQLGLIPEFEITKARKEFFLETVKETYLSSRKKYLIIPVAEGVRWYNEKSGKVDVVYASSEVDEYGHPRFGGISGIIASEIYNKLGIEARAQISGYYPPIGTLPEIRSQAYFDTCRQGCRSVAQGGLRPDAGTE